MAACEITVQELNGMAAGSYRLLDIRDEMSYSYGHLPGAENVPVQGLKEWQPPEPELMSSS